MKEVFLTKEGLEELKIKLDHLVSVRRMQCADNIKKAREFGDLSENAEYDAAKQEQGFVENEIREIEEKVLRAVIIDAENISTSEVSIGNVVEILDVEFNEKLSYRIVGTTEADAINNKISNESPLGNALIGRKKGNIVDVFTPNGTILKYKILTIK